MWNSNEPEIQFFDADKRTWLDDESVAYPNGAMRRRGRAVVRRNPHNPIVLPYGDVHAVRASIPDTYFSIPAKLRIGRLTVRGFVSVDETPTGPALCFTPNADPARCTTCAPGDGCKRD